MPFVRDVTAAAVTNETLLAAPGVGRKIVGDMLEISTDTLQVVSLESTTSAEETINVGYATGGTFTITVDAQETGNIDFDATAAEVVTALELLSTVTSCTATGTGTETDPWVVVFDDPADAGPHTVTIDDTNLTFDDLTVSEYIAASKEVTSVNVGEATGGTFTLTVDGQETANLDFDYTDAEIETQVELLSTVTTATVTGTGTVADPWVITIDTPLGPHTVTGDGANLTGGLATKRLNVRQDTAGTYESTSVDVGLADGGDFTITAIAQTTAAIAYDASAEDVIDALNLLSSLNPVNHVLNVDRGTSTGGTFTLTVDGTESAALDFDYLGSEIKTALELLDTVTTVGVTGTGTVGDPWVLTFSDPAGVVTVTGDGANLTGGDATLTLAVDTAGVDAVSCTGTGSPADPWIIGFNEYGDLAVSGTGTNLTNTNGGEITHTAVGVVTTIKRFYMLASTTVFQALPNLLRLADNAMLTYTTSASGNAYVEVRYTVVA